MARSLIHSIKFLAVAALFAALTPQVRAAPCTLTQVTGTITDPNGIPYAFGTVQVSLVPAPPGSPLCNGQPISSPLGPPTQLSSTGSFALAIPANSAVTPGSTQWLFTVNESPGVAPPFGFGPVSFSVAITITGATQSVTSQLTGAAVALTVPINGSGATPVGNVGDLQTKASSTALGASHINDSGTALSFSENVLQTASANIGLKYFPSANRCYVDSAGNDSDDGLSPGTAKATIMDGCYDSLPTEGGIISICATNDGVIPATAVFGTGIWIAGSLDPNFSSLPAGWRKYKSAYFLGECPYVAPPQGSKGVIRVSTSNTGPDIALSSLGGAAIAFENLEFLNFPTTSVQIGVDTNGNQTSTSGVVGVSFENIVTNCLNNISTAGPDWLIGGGDTFQIYMDRINAQGNPVATPGSDNQAAILIKPASSSNGQVGLSYITNSTVHNGGIKMYGAQGDNSLGISGLLSEGIIGPTSGTPIATVWVTPTAFSASVYRFQDITSSDTTNEVVDVRIDTGTDIHPPTGEDGATCVGNFFAGIIGPCNVAGGINTLFADPYTQGQTGFIQSREFGFDGKVQRQFSPVAVRWANLAPTSSSSWTITNSSGTNTITLGKTAPDGTTGAAQVNSTGTIFESVIFTNQNIAIAVGDWFVGGFWEQMVTGTGFVDSSSVNVVTVAGSGDTTSCISLPTPAPTSGEWLWVYKACQITAAPTTPATVQLAGTFAAVSGSGAGGTMNVYAPILIHIPAGQLVGTNGGQNEAAEIANALIPYNNNCPVGTIPCGLVWPTLSAGSVTLAGGAGSHTFTAPYPVAPICLATDTTATNAVKVTQSTTAVTLAGTGTDVINWGCWPGQN